MKFVLANLFLFTVFIAFTQDHSTINLKDLYGTWRIDSSAENRTFNVRPAINEEFFVFEENGFVRVKKIEEETMDSLTLGRYELRGDTLQITTLKGGPRMNFIMTMNTPVLELVGTFPISSSNLKKPTLFLSKKKIENESNGISVFRTEGQIIYRNVLNTITVSPLHEGEVVECPYCDTIYKGDSDNQFIIIPGLGKVSEVIVRDIALSQIISKTQLRNLNLPDPVLYFGSAKSGTKSSKRSRRFFAKYSPEMNLDFESTIEKWDVFIDGNTFSGVGDELSSEAAKFLENYKGHGVISILAVVRTADGIGRQLGGVFKL